MSKPSIPKGTRDFLPKEAARRDYIFSTIKSVFEKYGYLPIETPAMENTDTLMGKYGEEGDRLIFKILNSGVFIKNITQNDEARARWIRLFKEADEGTLDLENYFKDEVAKDLPKISNKALRYDLTVPFARFVVQHQNDITFPFKRYQIQPVWRADRPQKGRYREFYQCDVDVIGSDSLLNEVELVRITDEVFTLLGVDNTTIKINNRKILTGLAEVIGEKEKIVDITVAIDKLEKIGIEKVNEEMLEKGVSSEAVNKLQPLLQVSGSDDEKIARLREMLAASKTGLKGLDELEYLLTTCTQLNIENTAFDVTLARGLNYYTGAIFEVVTEGFPSSITGGGRYDDLTGIFGLPYVSGVGISFGADRIYDVMTERDLFPEQASAGTQVMFVNFGEKEAAYCLDLLKKLHSDNISAELYPDNVKMGKQMKYADSKGIPYVALVGEEEMKSGKLSVKNMQTGEQHHLSFEELLQELK